MNILGLTDAPVKELKEESLGLKEYVDALSNFINQCQTPMTIAIQGDWGTGKTSMMNLVRENLEKDGIGNNKAQIGTLWFNTWQFSQFDMQNELPISLLSSFSNALGESGKDLRKKIYRASTMGLKGLMKTGLNMVAGGVGDAANDFIEKLSGSEYDASAQLIELIESIKNAVREKLEKDNKGRLVVFIDDLDRLLPERAVELLEVLKLFLDVPQCVFVLAIDYNVVVKGLEKKFGVSIEDLKGKSFFDKIIQLPFNLPIAQYDTKKYFEELLKNGNFKYKKDDVERYIKLATLSVGFNPRSMKRLFNSLQLLNMVAQSKKIIDADNIASLEEKQRILFGVLCMQTAYDGFYRHMLKNIEEIGTDFFKSFKNPDEMLNESNSGLRKSLALNSDEETKKFMKFIEIFYESIQLESDKADNEGDILNEEEILALKRLLSFSSLTTSNVSNIEVMSDTSYKYGYVAAKIVEELNKKYLDKFKKLNLKIRPEQRADGFFILVDVTLGPLAFILCNYFLTNQYGVEFWDSDVSGAKYVTGAWAEKNLRKSYSTLAINNKKTYGYIDLWKKERQNDTSETNNNEHIEDFKEKIVTSLDAVLNGLFAFWEENQPTCEKVESFFGKLTSRLNLNFKNEEDWLIESNAKKFGKYGSIAMWHKDWWQKDQGHKVKIELQAEDVLFNNLFFGISRGKWNLKFLDEKEEFLKTAMKEALGLTQSSSSWWVGWYYLEDKLRYLVKKDSENLSFQFLFDDPKKEDEAIDLIVDKFSKLKAIKHIVDNMIL